MGTSIFAPRLHLPVSTARSRKELAAYEASDLFVHNYTPQELRHLAGPTKFCFATLPRTPPPAPPIASLYNPPTACSSSRAAYPHSHLRSLHALRCNPAFTSFTIYPTTAASLAVNDLLWRVAREGVYDPTDGDPLLGAHVFVLGLAPELHCFLSGVSLHDVHRAIVDFLVLLHHQLTVDEDDVGLEKLAQDLLPEVYEDLLANVGVFPNGEPTDPTRAQILEHLVQISFMTPWRVDVCAAYLTANDLTTLTFIPRACSPPRRAPTQQGANTCCAEQGAVMLKLYHDWRVFKTVLTDTMGLRPALALEAMERAVQTGKGAHFMTQAFAVCAAHASGRGLLATLPADVVQGSLVPWIVRRGCEAIPPRKRTIVSLKSLLQLSSQYLDGVRMVEERVARADEDAREVLVERLVPMPAMNGEMNVVAHGATVGPVGLGIFTAAPSSNEGSGDAGAILGAGGVEFSGTGRRRRRQRRMQEPRGGARVGSADGDAHYPLDVAPWCVSGAAGTGSAGLSRAVSLRRSDQVAEAGDR